MEVILDRLPQPMKEKTRQCILAKEHWVKLEKLYSVEQRTEISFSISRMKVMMENLAVLRKIKGVKPYKKKNLIKRRKTYISWKMVKMKKIFS